MRSGTIAFLSGIFCLLQCSYLPSLWPALYGIAFILALSFNFQFRYFHCAFLICSFLAGFSYANVYAQLLLAKTFPQDLEQKTLVVKGTVATIPVGPADFPHFVFNIQELNHKKITYRVRLSWYHPSQELKAGEYWQLTVRLKRPHGFANPGGFDFESLNFQKKLHANGYVINSSFNKCLIPTSAFQINYLRQLLSSKIHHDLPNNPFTGLVEALVIGKQDAISASQWDIFRATGTSHLMAISGLHIGLIAGFIFTMVNFLWRYATHWSLLYPARMVAGIAGFIGALIYSALAGFAVPTQRSVVMISVYVICALCKKQIPRWNVLLIALLFVVLLDPLSILTASLWLSFGAVAILIYGLSFRMSPGGLWWKWGRTQWVVSLGLIPLTLLLFQQASLISIFANIIAIPWMGSLVVPLCLLGSLLSLLPIHLGEYILQLAVFLIKIIWPILSWMAIQPHHSLHIYIPNHYLFLSMLFGFLLLLAPRGFPFKGLGFLFVLPLFFYHYKTPSLGNVFFTLLDVGQGLSVVVQTKSHTLIFDTGPKFSPTFDTGSAVILPFLQSSGIRKVDTLIVSHGDNDHIGGSTSLLQHIAVEKILTSVPEKFQQGRAEFCQQGQHWRWDNVDFDILYPVISLRGFDNDSSCVLRVSTGNYHLLLTGDIEKLGENYLVDHAIDQLPANILIAPHHGSRTSSSPNFIKAIQPNFVLIASGYLNKYHLPNAGVIDRYKNMNVIIYNTVKSGAISFYFNENGLLKAPEEYRQYAHHFWYAE